MKEERVLLKGKTHGASDILSMGGMIRMFDGFADIGGIQRKLWCMIETTRDQTAPDRGYIAKNALSTILRVLSDSPYLFYLSQLLRSSLVQLKVRLSFHSAIYFGIVVLLAKRLKNLFHFVTYDTDTSSRPEGIIQSLLVPLNTRIDDAH